MTNIEIVRDYVFKQFLTQMDVPYRNLGIEHTMQVVSYCLVLSKKRDLDEEVLVIAAYLHDLSTYISHYSQNHAARSAKIASEILPKITSLPQEKIKLIIQIIANHSSKNQIHDSLSETLKDADVISHFYSGIIIDEKQKERLVF